MRGDSDSRRGPGFTLIELLVVIAVLALLVSILTPTLQRAKKLTRRAVCAGNLHQFGLALKQYAQAYRRYPHQRHTGGSGTGLRGEKILPGGPMVEGINGLPVPVSAVGWEFDALIESGLSGELKHLASAPLPREARVLSCPNLPRAPVRDTYWPNGSGGCGHWGSARDDAYDYGLGYFWLGGTHYWTHAAVAWSARSPYDPGHWVLASDKILKNTTIAPPWWTNHADAAGEPTGANHLFNDGHVRWWDWDGVDGSNFRFNNTWWSAASGNRMCYFRRTVDTP